jgi:TPR repeat protein
MASKTDFVVVFVLCAIIGLSAAQSSCLQSGSCTVAELVEQGRAAEEQQNLVDASVLYRQAADQGSGFAGFRIGFLILNGLASGTPQDAIAYLTMAAQEPVYEAMVRLRGSSRLLCRVPTF